MNKKEEHITAFEDFEVEVPSALWERIEHSLNQKKKKRKLLLVRLVGGVAAIAMLLLATRLDLDTKKAAPAAESISEEKTPAHKGINPYLSAQKPSETTQKHPLTAATIRPTIAQQELINKPSNLSQPFGASPQKENITKLAKLQTKRAIWKSEIIVPRASNKLKVNGLYPDEWKMLKQLAQNNNKTRELDFSKAIGTQYSVFNTLNMNDNTENSIAGGISLMLMSNKRIGLQTGVYYAQLSNSSQGSHQPLASESFRLLDQNGLAVATPAQSTSWGEINAISTNNSVRISSNYNDAMANTEMRSPTDIEQEVGYIEVPLIVRYTLINQRLGVDVLGGLNNSFLVSNQASYKHNGRALSTKTEGLKSYNANSVAGLALNYKLSEQLQVGIEPKVKYYFNSLSYNTSISFTPIVFGIYTGLTYHF